VVARSHAFGQSISLKRAREFDVDQKSAVHDIATPALRQKDLDTADTYICRSANIAHNWRDPTGA
jgi:hypothetical protein